MYYIISTVRIDFAQWILVEKKHKSFITLTSEFNQKCSTPNTEKKVVHLFFGSLSQLSVE